MKGEQATPSSSGLYGGDGGAGGKFRKPPVRRPTTTPYDRPPATQSETLVEQRDGGWLSKLVDPAKRLIAGGATKIFPSIFSKLPSIATLPSSTAENDVEWGTDVKEKANGDGDRQCHSNVGVSTSIGVSSPIISSTDNININSDFEEFGRVKVSNLSEDNEFSQIEQLIKGKVFSRADIDRLTDIINSRSVLDPSNGEHNKRNPSMVTEGEGDRAAYAHENPTLSIEKKQGNLKRDTWETSTPLLRPTTVLDEVASSPVDLAKAYMRSRASEAGVGSKSIWPKEERALLQSEEFTSTPFTPSPSLKPNLCWPGAMVHEQRGHLTPQNHRGISGIHPRTPYSRTIYSKSKFQPTPLPAFENRQLGISSTTLQQSQTPIFGQTSVKSRNNVLIEGYGSVGPIRRIRHKFVSEAPPRHSISSNSFQTGPSQGENSSVPRGLLPATKNLVPGATSSNSEFQSIGSKGQSSKMGAPDFLPSSGRAVRAILEHLDRNQPTPHEKSAELKLATAWKKHSSSESADVMSKDHTSVQWLQGFTSQSNSDLADLKVSAQANFISEKSIFNERPQERDICEATDNINKGKASSGVIGTSSFVRQIDYGSSADLMRTNDFQIKSAQEKTSLGFTDSKWKETSKLSYFHSQINGQDVGEVVPSSSGSELPKKPPSHSSRTKRNLTSISVEKPDRRIVPSDNSSGFTFPVSASSGVLSEPPTPSIMPTSSASGLPLTNEEPSVPSYTFGTKRSTPSLVFSFPSTSNASAHDAPADLKFKFGSDQKKRVSFRSARKDAVCY